ncbi:MAG: cysteine peptidase family C39 domain-containing protein [Patescibacteria group bacterium]|nr:cysteine peptidase family C39 domain-containing protein [Patescibacteria group bacterium]
MRIISFPCLRQSYEWDCGASALQSVLAYYGFDIREEIIIKLAGTNKKGTPVRGIKKTLNKYKLAIEGGKISIEEIKNYLDREIPVIILLQAWTKKQKIDWSNDWQDGHYVVAIGYDSKKIYFSDPSSFRTTFLNYQELENRWHDIDSNGKKYLNWGLAVIGSATKDKLKAPEHMN